MFYREINGVGLVSLLPTMLSTAINLKFLSLRDNNLIQVPTIGIASSVIEELDVSNNPIRELNLASFRDMIKLQILLSSSDLKFVQ